MLFFLFHFFFVSLQSKHGSRTMQTSWVKTLALAIIQNVQKLAGGKNIQ